MSEPLLTLEAVRKVFPGGVVGLDDIDLAIGSGEFLSLLGPSGCGKTTTLRVIAGFETPTSGRVILDGRDIAPLRAYDRPVNTVFQDYALFPHMNVEENIGFGLSLRRVAPAERRKRVMAALELVGLPEKAAARVGELSGGQRQRIALARAMVCEPRVLLLDEPLSALDAHLREQMQLELKRLQTEMGTTFVMVTHDQTEAMSISDRIVVMNRGRIEQVASPAVLYDQPQTRFVAGFIGTMNLLPARVAAASAGEVQLDFGAFQVVTPVEDVRLPAAGSEVTAGIRPEDLVLSGGNGAIKGVASSIAFHGRSLRLRVEAAGGLSIAVDIPRQGDSKSLGHTEPVSLSLRPGALCRIFER